jgi:hypothetical protein
LRNVRGDTSTAAAIASGVAASSPRSTIRDQAARLNAARVASFFRSRRLGSFVMPTTIQDFFQLGKFSFLARSGECA